MTDKNKIAELNKAIKGHTGGAGSHPEGKAGGNGQPGAACTGRKAGAAGSRNAGSLGAGQSRRRIQAPEPTDRAELLTGFQKYRDAKTGKVAKVAAYIAAAEREQREITRALQQAAEDCDTEKTVELSEKRVELESKLKHLAEMRERVNALPLYPDGAIMEEWAAICERTLPDWKKAVLQVETLAEAYKAACAGLLEMYDTLQAVRSEIRDMAAAEGYTPPYFPRYLPPGWTAAAL